MTTDKPASPAIGGYVTLTARTGCEDALAAVLESARVAARGEPGCIYYDVFRSRTSARVFHLLEKYKDKTALKRHLDTPQARAMQSRLGELLDGDPAIVLMEELGGQT